MITEKKKGELIDRMYDVIDNNAIIFDTAKDCADVALSFTNEIIANYESESMERRADNEDLEKENTRLTDENEDLKSKYIILEEQFERLKSINMET